MKEENNKKTVSVSLSKEDYRKLKKLSEIESRSMASYIRSVIVDNYKTLTPLEKEFLD